MFKKVIYLLSLVFVITFASCKKDNGGNDNSVSVNTISAKWEISDSNSPYASFEFNKDGNYIVLNNDVGMNLRSVSAKSKASLFKINILKAVSMRSSESSEESNLSPIHFGTYKIDGDKIILEGFGVINVISITADEFTFSFTLTSTGETGNFIANKSAEPISSSTRTEMFCRTWVVKSLTIDGKVFTSNDDVIANGVYTDFYVIGSIVLFSRAGTYLVLYGGEGGEAGLSEWKWANTKETQLYYSWENWTDDWSDNIVTINKLSNSSLDMQEAVDDGYWIYHLTLKN